MNSTKAKPGLFLCNIDGFLLASKGCLTFLFFQSQPQTGTTVTTAVTLVWLLLVVGYWILDSPPPEGVWFDDDSVPRWIVLYLALSLASLAWTTTNSVLVAAGYWLGMAADVLSTWMLLRYEPIQQNMARIMYGYIVGAMLIAVIAWSSPAMEDMRLGHEDFLHPNMIGFEFAIAALFAGFLARQNTRWLWLSGAFVVTLLRTLSKGTIVGFVFAGLYYSLRGLNITRRSRLLIGVMSSGIVLAFWGLLETYLDTYTQGSNLETLTGRTYIWSQSLEIAMEKPWFGHGFDSFRWVFPPFEDFQPWHAHNDLIQQFFAFGFIGVLVVIAIYWTFYRQASRSGDFPLKALAYAILILVLVRGLVDTDRFELCFPLWLMTMLSVALARTTVVSHKSTI